MKEAKGGMWEGNVLVFNENKLAARFGGVLVSSKAEVRPGNIRGD